MPSEILSHALKVQWDTWYGVRINRRCLLRGGSITVVSIKNTVELSNHKLLLLWTQLSKQASELLLLRSGRRGFRQWFSQKFTDSHAQIVGQ